jgi:hypothetical protein
MGTNTMSSSSAQQQWSRRVRYSDQHIRVSDAERNTVAEILGQHYADGRLDQAEFDDRVGRTMAAKTRGDLAGLFDDLPDLNGASAPGPGGPKSSGPPLPYAPRRRGRFGLLRAIALVALVIILTNVAWHAFTSLFFVGPVLWGLCLAAIILLVVKGTHRRNN